MTATRFAERNRGYRMTATTAAVARIAETLRVMSTPGKSSAELAVLAVSGRDLARGGVAEAAGDGQVAAVLRVSALMFEALAGFTLEST